MTKCVAFLDTNIFMHCQPFDQINWPEILGSGQVELIVAPVVIRELDEHKDQHRVGAIRERARTALKKIETAAIDASDALPDGVSITIADEPKLAFAEYSLNETVNDDHLLACCIERKLKQRDADIAVFTDDTGVRIKGHKHLIRPVAPPDNLKLPSALEGVEKENKKLRRQIQQLETSLPKLELRFVDKQQSLILHAAAQLGGDDEHMGAQMAKLREQYPLLRSEPDVAPAQSTTADLAQLLMRSHQQAFNKPSPQEYDRYNTEREGYLQQHQEYLALLHTFEPERDDCRHENRFNTSSYTNTKGACTWQQPSHTRFLAFAGSASSRSSTMNRPEAG